MVSLPGSSKGGAVRAIGVAAIIVVVLLTACGQNAVGQSASAASPATSSRTDSSAVLSPTDNTSGIQAGWTTYTDKVGGYTLAAPADWHIQSLDGGMIVFQDPKRTTVHLDKELTGKP